MAKLKDIGLKVEYNIIGGGNLESELKYLSEKLSISSFTNFEGIKSRNEILYYLEKSDIFLIHSVTGSKGDMEGTPTVILEAGLSLKPVVSTNHAGIPEIIKHNESGFLTDEGDIDTMVKYLVELASNLELRKKFGRNLKNYIQKEYSEKINHERFVKKYSKHIFEK